VVEVKTPWMASMKAWCSYAHMGEWMVCCFSMFGYSFSLQESQAKSIHVQNN
jgi:hypothetical protein